MNYKNGTTVYSDGTLLGAIVYLIAFPHTHQITHLVIQQATKNTLKIVPLDLIDIQTNRAIILPRNTLWNNLSDFDSAFYEPINDNLHIVVPKSYLHPLYYYPKSKTGNVSKIPAEVVDDTLNTGMLVYDNNAQICGSVVKWNEDDVGQLMSMVLRIQNDDDHDVQIPISWISHTKAQEVYLDIERNTLTSELSKLSINDQR